MFTELRTARRRAPPAPRGELARVSARAEIAAPRDRTAVSSVSFLSGHGVAPVLLLAAEAEAARLGVAADAALLAGDAIDEARFYRRLARHLRCPFVEQPHFAPETTRAALAARVARLDATTADGRPIFAFAPRGAEIVALARALRRPRGPGGEAAIVAPSVYAAALRRQLGGQIADAARDAAPPALSARTGATRGQIGVLIATVALCLGALAPSGWPGEAATAFLSAIFLAAIAVRLSALAQTLLTRPAAPAPRLPDRDLPRYAIVIALYREAAVARDLIAALEAIDYPGAKLEVKLVLEDDDAETRAALLALDLPARYAIVVAPDGRPRTKPRALNVALAELESELVVVFDAEDRPEPDQLRKAAARFAVAPPDVACLQARLAIDNGADGWLARLFAIEYAALFDALDPGFAALDMPLPLGGTSNHFRVAALRGVGGWDAWNVTEDADLGLRLARSGLAVETLDSTTWEEAPFTLRAWLGQRGRWLKGWMQTLLVHTRAAPSAAREFGPARAFAAWATIGGALASALFLPLFGLRTALDIARGDWLTAGTPLQWLAATLSLSVFVFGPFAAFGPPALGLWRRGWMRQAPWLLLLPVYYLLASLAAWRALFEACFAPHRWVKTQHGVSRRRPPMPGASSLTPGA